MTAAANAILKAFPGARIISVDDPLGAFVDALYSDAVHGELLFNYRSGDRFLSSWHGLDVAALANAARRQHGDVWVADRQPPTATQRRPRRRRRRARRVRLRR